MKNINVDGTIEDMLEEIQVACENAMDFKPNIIVENDSIGSYEFWGSKEYDRQPNYLTIDDDIVLDLKIITPSFKKANELEEKIKEIKISKTFEKNIVKSRKYVASLDETFDEEEVLEVEGIVNIKTSVVENEIKLQLSWS